jgi:hypothetical protein
MLSWSCQLISVGEKDPCWQFCDRVWQLAAEFKIRSHFKTLYKGLNLR